MSNGKASANHAKTDYGSTKTDPAPQIEDVVNLVENTYAEGKDGILPGIFYGEAGEHHRYVFLYALIAIAIGTALALLSYQLFVRHVVKVYNEEHDGDDDDDDSGAEEEAELMESSDEDAKKSTMKRKGPGARSATPQPSNRSKSASSAESSPSKSKKGKKVSGMKSK